MLNIGKLLIYSKRKAKFDQQSRFVRTSSKILESLFADLINLLNGFYDRILEILSEVMEQQVNVVISGVTLFTYCMGEFGIAVSVNKFAG
jgi:hypothetical protein